MSSARAFPLFFEHRGDAIELGDGQPPRGGVLLPKVLLPEVLLPEVLLPEVPVTSERVASVSYSAAAGGGAGGGAGHLGEVHLGHRQNEINFSVWPRSETVFSSSYF